MMTIQQARTYERQFGRYADWLTVKQYADQVYGKDKVASIKIETDYYDRTGYIEKITAHDILGKWVKVDTTTDFMRDVLGKEGDEEHGWWSQNDMSDEVWQKDIQTAIKHYKNHKPNWWWITWEYLPLGDPDDHHTDYDLRTIPSIPLMTEDL